jgi:hypothetical protein
VKGPAIVNNRIYRKYRDTFLDIAIHLAVTAILALFFYKLTGSWVWPVLALLGGIFIDLDHFIDYFLYFGWKFSLKDFLDHRYLDSGKVYIFFHSWELAAGAWIFSIVFSWLVPVAASMTLHLFIDFLFSHRCRPQFLSLLYRRRHKFDYDKLCPGPDFK